MLCPNCNQFGNSYPGSMTEKETYRETYSEEVYINGVETYRIYNYIFVTSECPMCYTRIKVKYEVVG